MDAQHEARRESGVQVDAVAEQRVGLRVRLYSCHVNLSQGLTELA